MRHSERKRNQKTMGVFSGLLGTVLCFLCLLCLLALLVKSGSVSDSLLRLLLPLGCLLCGAVGAVSAGRQKDDRLLSLLLSGTVPSGCLLCCGLAVSGSEAGHALLWNVGALLLPSLAAMLPTGRKPRRIRR